MASRTAQSKIAQIVAVHANGSVGGIDQPGQQLGDGGLAYSAGPKKRYHLAGVNSQVGRGQRRRRSIGIAVGDRFEVQPSTDPVQLTGAGPFDDPGRGVEEFQYPLGPGRSRIDSADDVAEFLHRAVEHAQIGEEGEHPSQ